VGLFHLGWRVESRRKKRPMRGIYEIASDSTRPASICLSDAHAALACFLVRDIVTSVVLSVTVHLFPPSLLMFSF
jgi:hypothetical protein